MPYPAQTSDAHVVRASFTGRWVVHHFLKYHETILLVETVQYTRIQILRHMGRPIVQFIVGQRHFVVVRCALHHSIRGSLRVAGLWGGDNWSLSRWIENRQGKESAKSYRVPQNSKSYYYWIILGKIKKVIVLLHVTLLFIKLNGVKGNIYNIIK